MQDIIPIEKLNTEYEVKFELGDLTTVEFRKKLLEQGAVEIEPRFLMKRCTFDIPGAKKGTFLRIRQESPTKSTLTYKSLQELSLSGMKEVEIKIDKFESGLAIVKLLGLQQATYEENFRTKFFMNKSEITIDEWPGIPPITEIESETETDVTDTAEHLGFNMHEGFYGNINEVYKKHGIDISGLQLITFDNIPQKHNNK